MNRPNIGQRISVIDVGQIPEGNYCYQVVKLGETPDGEPCLKTRPCPYWTLHADRPGYENGECLALNLRDWDADGLTFLWDGVKECEALLDEPENSFCPEVYAISVTA